MAAGSPTGKRAAASGCTLILAAVLLACSARPTPAMEPEGPIAFCRAPGRAAAFADVCVCSIEGVEQPLSPAEFLSVLRDLQGLTARELLGMADHARAVCNAAHQAIGLADLPGTATDNGARLAPGTGAEPSRPTGTNSWGRPR